MTSPLRVHTTTLVQVADYRSGDAFGPRRLYDYEFVWLLRGSATWTVSSTGADGSRAGEQRHQLAPGTLALSRPGTVDSYHWDPHRASTHAYIHFDVPDLGPLASPGAGDNPGEDDWPLTRSLLDSPILAGICGYLLQLAGQQSDRARQRSDELIPLLLDLFVAGPLEQPGEALPQHLAKLARHVQDVWGLDGLRIVAVPELARAAGISPGHVYRLFRQTYGCGPVHAFELLRLSRAAVSLQRSNATIAEIAEQTGFANPYHFSRRFAATYGHPPGAFRSLQPALDALDPVRRHGLLPVARAVLYDAVSRPVPVT